MAGLPDLCTDTRVRPPGTPGPPGPTGAAPPDLVARPPEVVEGLAEVVAAGVAEVVGLLSGGASGRWEVGG
jgi:hypothetical protein